MRIKNKMDRINICVDSFVIHVYMNHEIFRLGLPRRKLASLVIFHFTYTQRFLYTTKAQVHCLDFEKDRVLPFQI